MNKIRQIPLSIRKDIAKHVRSIIPNVVDALHYYAGKGSVYAVAKSLIQNEVENLVYRTYFNEVYKVLGKDMVKCLQAWINHLSIRLMAAF